MVAGSVQVADRRAGAVVRSLQERGIDASYLGRVDDPRRIAERVCHESADSVELCLGPAGGVMILRGLLRELTELGRRDVSIVVHRIM